MATQSNHEHVLIIEDDKGRKEYPLEENVYSIGRDQKSDIRLFSQFVSRQHATLVRHERADGSPYYRIVDGNAKGKPSANGLFINGRKTKTHDLEDGDKIEFGPNVTAKYLQFKRETTPTGPIDEFDITLISPWLTWTRRGWRYWRLKGNF